MAGEAGGNGEAWAADEVGEWPARRPGGRRGGRAAGKDAGWYARREGGWRVEQAGSRRGGRVTGEVAGSGIPCVEHGYG